MIMPLAGIVSQPKRLWNWLWLFTIVPSMLIDAASPYYTVYEDATWAVRSTEMPQDRFPIQVAEYKHFIQGCRDAAGSQADHRCGEEEQYRVHMNTFQPQSMRNYTKLGYKKIRAPKAMYKLLKDFWDANKDSSVNEWGKVINTYHNMWESPPTVILVSNETLIGGGNDLNNKLLEYAQAILEEWTGQRLAPCSLYGIRIYPDGSILTPHVDRNPLITSAIINVMQDVDEPWPLEVYGHDGVASNVTMEPGDMVLYESHSVIHSRPFRLKGRYFANIFVHFEALGNLDGSHTHRDGDLPPWVIGGSAWEPEWRKDNPGGWKLDTFHDPHDAATRGDLKVLQNLALVNPEKLHHADPNGWRPFHESVRAGNLAAVKFLLDHGADLQERTNQGEGYSPLRIAYNFLGEDHEISKFLQSLGAVAEGPEL